jgi:hypothetical protein
MKPLVIIISLFSLLSSIISPAQAAVAVIAHPSVANADHKIIKKYFSIKPIKSQVSFVHLLINPFIALFG